MLNIGIIGYGYWGPNLVRNFNSAPNTDVRCICDLDQKKLTKADSLYPSITITTDIEEVLKNESSCRRHSNRNPCFNPF